MPRFYSYRGSRKSDPLGETFTVWFANENGMSMWPILLADEDGVNDTYGKSFTGTKQLEI
jgi:hypothetical protein